MSAGPYARLAAELGQYYEPDKGATSRHSEPARVFAEFSYRTRKSWSRSRRVVAKAEYLDKGENPRFVVTSLPAESWEAAGLYEKTYCARCEMENRIKEQLSLFADRMSAESLRANQLRLYFSSLAYVLVHALRRLALAGTEWAHAQVHTVRLRLLKIAAEVRWSARRIWVSYSNAYPWKHIFAAAWVALRC
ncbi:MAG TPA: transposase [Terriglobales bacterium]|nr:transposase [Terriglobales bacterium]